MSARIMIVDDEPGIVDVVQRYFALSGYKVRAKLSAKTLHNYIETVWGVGYRWNG